MDEPSWIELGYVARPHGIKGELRIRLHNPDSDALEVLETIYLRKRGVEEAREYRVVGYRALGDHVGVRLSGLESRTEAESLSGAVLLIPEDVLPPPEEDEYYHFELMGLKVVDPQGQSIGTLEHVISTPGDDLYVVQGPDGELVIPARARYVSRIDLEQGILEVARLEELKACDED